MLFFFFQSEENGTKEVTARKRTHEESEAPTPMEIASTPTIVKDEPEQMDLDVMSPKEKKKEKKDKKKKKEKKDKEDVNETLPTETDGETGETPKKEKKKKKKKSKDEESVST